MARPFLSLKKCIKCGQLKKHKAHGLCKKCYTQKWDNEHKEQKRIKGRIWARLHSNSKKYGGYKYYKLSKEYKEKHKLALIARRDANKAIRSKKIKQSPCIICGSIENLEKHHPDYTQPLNIIWYCRKHHYEIHHK